MNRLVRPFSTSLMTMRTSNIVAPIGIRSFASSKNDKDLMKNSDKEKDSFLKEPKKYAYHEFDDAMRYLRDNFFNNKLSRWFHEADDYFSKDLSQNDTERGNWRIPKTFWNEKDNEYCMRVELPGFAKDDIKVNFSKNKLIIETKKDEKSSKDGEESWSHRSFYKSISLPENVKHEDICAKMENGELLINIPKSVEIEDSANAKRINIK